MHSHMIRIRSRKKEEPAQIEPYDKNKIPSFHYKPAIVSKIKTVLT